MTAKKPAKRKTAPPAKKRPAAKKAAPKKQERAKSVRKLLADPPRIGPDAPLTHEQELFVTEYLTNGLNGTAAYMSSHPDASPAAAAVSACRWLKIPKIKDRIDAERKRLSKVSEMTREAVIEELTAIILADPAELCQMRRVCCPECWGSKETGAWTEPNPECPACSGDGLERPWFADTRKLPPAARALFAGVKVSKEGMQLLMESKSDARDKLYKILGHYKADNEQRAGTMGEAFAQFLGQLHGNQAGKLPITPPKARPKVEPS